MVNVEDWERGRGNKRESPWWLVRKRGRVIFLTQMDPGCGQTIVLGWSEKQSLPCWREQPSRQEGGVSHVTTPVPSGQQSPPRGCSQTIPPLPATKAFSSVLQKWKCWCLKINPPPRYITVCWATQHTQRYVEPEEESKAINGGSWFFLS